MNARRKADAAKTRAENQKSLESMRQAGREKMARIRAENSGPDATKAAQDALKNQESATKMLFEEYKTLKSLREKGLIAEDDPDLASAYDRYAGARSEYLGMVDGQPASSADPAPMSSPASAAPVPQESRSWPFLRDAWAGAVAGSQSTNPAPQERNTIMSGAMDRAATMAARDPNLFRYGPGGGASVAATPAQAPVFFERDYRSKIEAGINSYLNPGAAPTGFDGPPRYSVGASTPPQNPDAARAWVLSEFSKLPPEQQTDDEMIRMLKAAGLR